MTLRALAAIAVLFVCWAALEPPAEAPASAEPPAGARGSPRTLMMEGVRLQAYEAGSQTLHVDAARAYASTKRWGFFHIGLMPTLEVEEVIIERPGLDGSMQRAHRPVAVIDWTTKQLDQLH